MKANEVRISVNGKVLARGPTVQAALSALPDGWPRFVVDTREKAEPSYTSHQVGQMLKANPTSVNKWATEGHIDCYKTPGGHRRFTKSSVAAFAKKFNMPLGEVA